MKKTLLATALAVGFAGAAAAQTSVTLYGIVDAGLGSTQYKIKNSVQNQSAKATQTGLIEGGNSGNRWGLRGSEDLGGGLKAIFQLESGYSLRTGNSAQGNRLFGRHASIGLQNDAWGTVKLGRQTNFAAQYFVGTPNGDGFGLGGSNTAFTSASTIRTDNMVTYESASFSGFQFGLGYSFQNAGPQPWKISDLDDTDNTAITTGLRYNNGPLTVAFSYDVLHGNDLLDQGDVKSWILSGRYNFDGFSLHLGFGQDKDGVLSGRGVPEDVDIGFNGTFGQDAGYIADGYKTNNYGAGVTIPLNDSEVRLGWSSARLGSSVYKTTITAGGGKSSRNAYSAIYTHKLSNRTNLYVAANYVTGIGFDNIDGRDVLVGLRHQF